MREANLVQKNETIKEVGKFGSVGILNTIIDLGIFNVLVFLFKMAVVPANVIAVSAAIINSYVFNKYWTFKDKDVEKIPNQALLFIFFSLIGLVLNTTVLKILTDIWTLPGNIVLTIVNAVGLSSIFSDEFVTVNFAKATGLAVSMVWNFLTYKKIVFKK